MPAYEKPPAMRVDDYYTNCGLSKVLFAELGDCNDAAVFRTVLDISGDHIESKMSTHYAGFERQIKEI